MLCWNGSASNTGSYIFTCLSSSIFGVCHGFELGCCFFSFKSSQILTNIPSMFCVCIGLCFFWLVLWKGFSQTWENMGEMFTLACTSLAMLCHTHYQSQILFGLLITAQWLCKTMHIAMGDFSLPLAIKTPGEWAGQLFKNLQEERCTTVI